MNLLKEKEAFFNLQTGLRRRLLDEIGPDRIGHPPFAEPVLRLMDGLDEVDRALWELAKAEVPQNAGGK